MTRNGFDINKEASVLVEVVRKEEKLNSLTQVPVHTLRPEGKQTSDDCLGTPSHAAKTDQRNSMWTTFLQADSLALDVRFDMLLVS